MCWVALDRASALAEIRGDPKMAATWRATADPHRRDRRRPVRHGGNVPDLLVLACVALAIVGETQQARDLMERLLRIASPLGLYAEEFDPETGRHLANFSQAFSHLALIEAAARMIIPEKVGEF
jgi:GH15 family glucan-1,4-alpha-glucosidase